MKTVLSILIISATLIVSGCGCMGGSASCCCPEVVTTSCCGSSW